MNNTQNHKIPLVIGITGHRDIDESHIHKLEEKITEIFNNLTKKYPNTPLVLLTPLADGADRIIAHVALRDKYKDNITVSVPLPIDEKNYKDTFAIGITEHNKAKKAENTTKQSQLEEESKKEFDDLIEKVKAQDNEYIPKTIPMLFDQKIYNDLYEKDNEEIDKNYYREHFSNYVKLPSTYSQFMNDLKNENERIEKKNKENPDELQREPHNKATYLRQQIRREQYSIVGEYIAIHSHILIALYDENEEEKSGGTKEIVRKKLTGEYEHFKIKNEDVTYPETGIVYSITTPKGKNECTKKYEIKRLFSDKIEKIGLSKVEDKIENIYTKFHKKLDEFNKNVAQNINEIEKDYYKRDLSKVSWCTDKLIHKNMMIRRSAAYLAEFYKNKMKIREKIILALISLTTFALMIQSNSPDFVYSIYINPFYLGIIALFFITYHKFKQFKGKQEDYRAISEAMRVQIAWKMAHINDSVALHYLSYQKNEIGWIRTAVRATNIFYLPKGNQKIEEEQIKSYWLNEQIDYLKKRKEECTDEEKNINKKIKYSFILFLLFTAIFTVLDFTTYISQCTTMILGFSLVDILKLVLIGIPFTFFTYLKSKQHFDGNNDLIKEYNLSLDIFNRAKKLCDNTSNKQEVYKNLGIEALRENSSWIISRREKDYEIS